MKKTKRKLRSLTIFALTIITCFALLIGQSSSEGESNFTKSAWQFFMEQEREPPFVVSLAVDAYFWRKMPEVQKYGYVTGYVSGFKAGASSAWAAATGDTQWPFNVFHPRVSCEKLTEAVDEFYSDYANRGIYFGLALPIVIGRIEGYISDTEAKEEIQKARRASSRIPKTR